MLDDDQDLLLRRIRIERIEAFNFVLILSILYKYIFKVVKNMPITLI